MTDSARIHTWGCDRHTENTYEGCASCDLEDFSELSSKLAAANARIAELENVLRQTRGYLANAAKARTHWEGCSHPECVILREIDSLMGS